MLPKESTPGQTMKMFNHGFRDLNHPITLEKSSDHKIPGLPLQHASTPCQIHPRSRSAKRDYWMQQTSPAEGYDCSARTGKQRGAEMWLSRSYRGRH